MRVLDPDKGFVCRVKMAMRNSISQIHAALSHFLVPVILF